MQTKLKQLGDQARYYPYHVGYVLPLACWAPTSEYGDNRGWGLGYLRERPRGAELRAQCVDRFVLRAPPLVALELLPSDRGAVEDLGLCWGALRGGLGELRDGRPHG